MNAAQDDLTLIPAQDGDRAFFVECHHAAYRATVEQMFAWNVEEQDALVSAKFDQPGTHLIRLNGAGVGVVGFHPSDTHVLLRDFFVLPAHQNSGIGGRVLCHLQDLAQRAGLGLRLRTLRVNSRAARLYERYGFRVSGRDDLHIHMAWDPRSAMRAHPLEAIRARAADFGAVFAIPAFATYQLGNVVMTTGFWMQRIGVGWLTWQLTESEAWLGLVASAELFPSILTAMWGGALADRHPAPRIMYWGQIASAAIALALALLFFAGALTPWAIVVLMVALGAVSGLLLPARLAMARYLAPPELLPSALAVNSTGFNLSRFLGPALAAGLLVLGSAGLVFAVAAAGFLALGVALHRIRDVPPQQAPHPATTDGMLKILRDLRASPLILGVLALQFAQGILIRPASELFPAYAEVAFDTGAVGLGLLNAALGVGAILGALAFSKSRGTAEALQQIVVTGAVFALSLLVFSVTGLFWLALLVLVVHGASMAASNIAALAYVQLEAPPDRVGRILALYTIIFRVGPAAGALVFGLTAEVAGLTLTGAVFGLAGLVATLAIGANLMRERKHHA